jgi:hypothetical protein
MRSVPANSAAAIVCTGASPQRYFIHLIPYNPDSFFFLVPTLSRQEGVIRDDVTS